MIKIDYPHPSFRIKKENGKEYIFDPIRKKWILLTPEEWVRQNFLQYLIQIKKYPSALIAVEKEISLGDLKKRFDILVYNKQQPWMMIECKATDVSLSETVLQQALRYTIAMPVSYIVITNGNETMAWQKQETLSALDDLPIME